MKYMIHGMPFEEMIKKGFAVVADDEAKHNNILAQTDACAMSNLLEYVIVPMFDNWIDHSRFTDNDPQKCKEWMDEYYSQLYSCCEALQVLADHLTQIVCNAPYYSLDELERVEE